MEDSALIAPNLKPPQGLDKPGYEESTSPQLLARQRGGPWKKEEAPALRTMHPLEFAQIDAPFRVCVQPMNQGKFIE